MKRSWHVWLVFAVCVLGAVGAMVWLTRQAIESDRQRQIAQADAELEQNVSLALWRMDTELAPIIAEEVIRPSAAYRPAIQIEVAPPEYVLLQFEAVDADNWRSPQMPLQQSREIPRLAELSSAVKLSQLLEQLPVTHLPPAVQAANDVLVQNEANAPAAANTRQFFEGNSVAFPEDDLFGPPLEESPDQSNLEQTAQVAQAPSKKGAKNSKLADFEQRNQRFQSAAQQSLSNYAQQQRAIAANQEPAIGSAEDSSRDVIGVSRPIWVGERLLLARRVGKNGQTAVQGCWLDWEKLKTRLLAEAADLLPQANLVPVQNEASLDPGRMLAGLPVRLEVGAAPMVAALSPALKFSLWMGWGALAVATAAAAALLYGVMALSERRAAFVSSVSHELRTPLTTFRMYAEMLARGMVPDGERRQEYLETLQREAERLTLLVENVLAYARLERGRRPQADDHVTMKMLADRIGPRLAQRAAQVEMECELWLDGVAAETNLTTDLNVVEQILFNLVDNAAKYARSASNRMIEVVGTREGRWVKLAVSDHGPGFASGGKVWRARPFAKSAEESAETAPGVGLGLALCQKLARQLGGRLEQSETPGGGATVTLLLPCAPNHRVR